MKRNRDMRKLILLLVAALMVIPLVAATCTSSAPAAPTSKPAEKAAPAPPAPSPVQKTTAAPAPKPAPVQKTTAAPAPKPQAQPAFKWRMQALLAPEHPITKQVLPYFADKVNKASGGRIQVQIFQSAALAPTFETFKAVNDGVLELAASGASYNVGFMPMAEMVLGWPGTFEKLEEFTYFLYTTGYIDLVRKAYGEKGVFYLGPDVPLLYGPLLTRVPVNSLKDLKGLKIRAVGVLGELMKDLEASPTMIPMQDIYTATSQGVIHGSIPGGVSSMFSLKLYETAKYALWPPLQTWAIIDWIASPKAWNALPDDLKAIVLATQREATTWGTPLTYQFDLQALNTMVQSHGLKLATLPEADAATLRKMALAKLDERAKKDANSAAMVNIFKDALKKFGYIK